MSTPVVAGSSSSQPSNSSSLGTIGTSSDFEIKNLTWELKFFTYMFHLETLKRSNPQGYTQGSGPFDMAKFEFNAGDSIKAPSKWEFYFDTSNLDKDFLGINLRLKSSAQDEVFAEFKIQLKGQKGEVRFSTHTKMPEMYRRDFIKTVNGISNALGSLKHLIKDGSFLMNHSLTIHIGFKMYLRNTLASNFYEKKYSLREIGTMEHFFKEPMAQDLQALFVSGRHSDVIIRAKDGKEFRMHKAILSSRSPVFLKMFESVTMTESLNGVVHVDEVSSEGIGVILKFIYTGTLEDGWKDYIEEIVYAAEKYELTPLKKFCDHTLINLCTKQNVLKLLNLAKKFNLRNAFKEISDYVKGNSDIVTQLLGSDT